MTHNQPLQSPGGSMSPSAAADSLDEERIKQLLARLEAIRAKKGGKAAKPETAIQLVTRYQWEVENLHARNATQAEVCEYITSLEAECPFQEDTIRKALKAVIPNWRRSVKPPAKTPAPSLNLRTARPSFADTVNQSGETW